MKTFLRKRWSDILLGLFLLLMIIPQTRQPIQIFIQRLIAFSPSTVAEDEQIRLENYNLQLQNSNSEIINLTDYQDQVIILNFWATWCPPCIAEMPDFSKVYKDYSDKVNFFFITQEKWDKINTFEEKRNFELPYFRLLEPNATLDYRTLPTTYVIDKKGKIVIDKVGVADWNAKSFREDLDKLIAE
jgi:thiol-disulfide isomerase/thioredoxin